MKCYFKNNIVEIKLMILTNATARTLHNERNGKQY